MAAKSLFQRFKDGLKKTTPTFYKALSKTGQLFGGTPISLESLDELEEALYTADFGEATTQDVLQEIKAAYKKNKELRNQEAAKIGSRVLQDILQGAAGRLPETPEAMQVICMVGVNGAGKTTTTAKLGYALRASGRSVLLGACDTFRAAANEQILSWSKRLDLEIVSSHQGADSAAVAFDAMDAATSRKKDFLILDTAGRLHTKDNLMKELAKLKRVIQKKDETAPHHSWLVVDGSLGSNSIEQARIFHQEFGLTGLIITKLDGTSRGGALVGIYRELGLPIYYIGLGEQPEDLQPFDVKLYCDAIFGVDERNEHE